MAEFHRPRAIFLTGPYGAGKSTFADKIQQQTGIQFFGSDKNPGKTPKRRFEELKEQIGMAISYRRDFAVDDVFRERKIEAIIKPAVRQEYQTELHIILIKSPELCINRIKQRVKEKGHSHTETGIRQRFIDAPIHAAKLVDIMDWVGVYDNTTRPRRLIATLDGKNFQSYGEIPVYTLVPINAMRDKAGLPLIHIPPLPGSTTRTWECKPND